MPFDNVKKKLHFSYTMASLSDREDKSNDNHVECDNFATLTCATGYSRLEPSITLSKTSST